MPWCSACQFSAKRHFDALSITNKVPSIVVKRRNLRLEIDAALSGHHIVVANALIPRRVSVDALLVHVDPGLLEAQDPGGREIDA